MIPNYYTLLGVSSRASTSEIKRAYRRMARQFHPDLNALTEDEQIKRINEAYAVLSNSRQRQRYDELLRQARKQAEAAREPKISWAQGAAGFVRELKEGLQDEGSPGEQEEVQPAPKMTWMQGAFGFVREMKKEMRDD